MLRILEQTDSIFIFQVGRAGAMIFSVILMLLFGYLMFRFWGTPKVWLLAFCLLGSFVFLSLSVTLTVTFDKTKDIFTIAYDGLVRHSKQEYKLSEIKDVKLTELFGVDALYIDTKDGQTIYLHSRKPGIFLGKKSLTGMTLPEVGSKLSKFLNVPLNAR
jgi:hypothetical protein